MPRKRILVSWIGHADLRAFAQSLSADKKEDLLSSLGPGPADLPGPVKTLTENEVFSEIHLLANYESRWTRAFCKWLGKEPHIHAITLENPTDYAAVYVAASGVLETIRGRGPDADVELCIHLSPGTPAMAAVWVLLGKTRFPATFFQTHKGRAWKTEIPFDITADFLPELLKHPDSHLQHLAAESPSEVQGFQNIIGDSPAIRLAVGRARLAAVRHVSILLLGESGTGKEMFARAIHEASLRKGKPFVAINCAAIPRELLESELFGHKKGAFTGAERDRPGAFDQAAGGTLFLDEVGECDPAMQVKLLRVLEPSSGGGPCDRVFRPVGSTSERSCDVRVVAATNRNLITEVKEGRFREDLFYRLAVISVTLPPLRERPGDIPKLATAFLDRVNREFRSDGAGFSDKSISPSAMGFVKRHDWPGNIRQLYNAILQAVTMADGNVLERADFEVVVADPAGAALTAIDLPLGDNFSLQRHLEDIHRHFLKRAMEEANGVKTAAARLLGIANYQTLDAQLTRLRVSWSKDAKR